MTARVVAVIAVAVALLGAAWILAARSTRSYRQPLIAVLPRADGVREGTPVTYLGLQIGHVRRLRIQDGRVVADLRLRSIDPPLRQGDSLQVRTLGLLGDRVLDVVPGKYAGPPLTAVDTIFAIPGPRRLSGESRDSLRRVLGGEGAATPTTVLPP